MSKFPSAVETATLAAVRWCHWFSVHTTYDYTISTVACHSGIRELPETQDGQERWVGIPEGINMSSRG